MMGSNPAWVLGLAAFAVTFALAFVGARTTTTCETYACTSGLVCTEDKVTSRPFCCRDVEACPRIYRPVCGTDDVTYSSLCVLQKTACDQQTRIDAKHNGPCATCETYACTSGLVCTEDKVTSRPFCCRDVEACPRIYRPVCGTDDVTYSSLCVLQKTACDQQTRIDAKHNGPCVSEKSCSLSDGSITMFNEETLDVKVPCKFRMADFTCGGYRVKVTAGVEMDSDDTSRFSFKSMWIKIVHLESDGEELLVRTSTKRVKQFQAGSSKIDNAWQVISGSSAFLDSFSYDTDSQYGLIGIDDGFGIRYDYSDSMVTVTCPREELSSKGLPDTLCGDGVTRDAVNRAAEAVLGSEATLTPQQFIHYVIMNDGTVTQSKKCEEMAAEFQTCERKDLAAKDCESIFSSPAQAGSDTLTDDYLGCLESSCDFASVPLGDLTTSNDSGQTA